MFEMLSFPLFAQVQKLYKEFILEEEFNGKVYIKDFRMYEIVDKCTAACGISQELRGKMGKELEKGIKKRC